MRTKNGQLCFTRCVQERGATLKQPLRSVLRTNLKLLPSRAPPGTPRQGRDAVQRDPADRSWLRFHQARSEQERKDGLSHRDPSPGAAVPRTPLFFLLFCSRLPALAACSFAQDNCEARHLTVDSARVSLINADIVRCSSPPTRGYPRIVQLVSGISWILIEESAEGSAVRSTWTSIGLMIDLICCVAVLFPVVRDAHTRLRLCKCGERPTHKRCPLCMLIGVLL
jgi:hypothetical protein